MSAAPFVDVQTAGAAGSIMTADAQPLKVQLTF
jgi:hypothetical protein